MQVNRLIGIKRKAKREGWLDMIRNSNDERAALNGCWFSHRRADHVEKFFSQFLRHSKGRWHGQPFELMPWQKEDITKPLFGWLRDPNCNDPKIKLRRRFEIAYIELPKKNGKSTMAAGVGLYGLAGDGEMGAEIYSAANDRHQASIVHKEAISMVKSSPILRDMLNINQSTWNISFQDTGSYYRAMSGDGDSNEGVNGHFCIVDELHSWRGDKLWNSLRYMFEARLQPLLFIITTAGDNPESICKQQHDYAKEVISGVQYDQRYYGYIRAAEIDDDPLDEETWKKANPSYGVTISPERFAADALESSKRNSSFNSWKRYKLNLWQTGSNPWLKNEDWKDCQEEFTIDDLVGRECWMGLDLSKTTDTSSLQIIFPDPDEDDRYRLLSYFWLPEEKAQEYQDRVSYLDWERAGLIELTPGNVVDYRYIKDQIVELVEKYDLKVKGLLYDPMYAEQITQDIEDEAGVERVIFKQTIMHFAKPTADFEKLVISGRINHNGHAVMTWQIGNVEVKSDYNDNIRPVKPKTGELKKIDGPVAAIMALAGPVELEAEKYIDYQGI